MHLGIDASNIRGGGGVTHLIELLRAADPVMHGFTSVTVWGGHATLSRIEARPWLVKSHQTMLDKSLPCRTYWQRFRLSKLAQVAGCAALLVPGGSYSGDFRPMITMSRNMLPFEWRELRRYGWSWMSLKLSILRFTQSRTFRRANGLIFLTRYAHDVVLDEIKKTHGKTVIVPHGINTLFSHPPHEQKPIHQYSFNQPFRIIYVSIIEVYKHQWHVAEAISILCKQGYPIILELVGPSSPPALRRLKKTLNRIDPDGKFVQYLGPVPYEELYAKYAQANLCLFASSCENMPNILIEGMISGLPIACASKGPMPEMLGGAGVYFNPESPEDIARALKELLESHELRAKLAKTSFELAQTYSWKRCAAETFAFISSVIEDWDADLKHKAKSA
jgi:glycosyltransferase involved in cell wall biosynthesis